MSVPIYLVLPTPLDILPRGISTRVTLTTYSSLALVVSHGHVRAYRCSALRCEFKDVLYSTLFRSLFSDEED